jgi:hypothetical protein
MKKGDFIIILSLAVLIIGYGFFYFFPPSSSSSYVTITQNSKLLYQLPLNEDAQVRVEAPNGGYNLIVVEAGKAFIKEADCADLSCTRSRPIFKPGQVIVCLPHRLVVACGGSPSFFDAVTE